MWMDLTNGIFETIGAMCVLLNVHRLHVDREIRGVHWAPTIFFTSWGLWNVVYYPSLGQWWSTAGGALLVLANLWWLVLVWRYRRPVWHSHPSDDLQFSAPVVLPDGTLRRYERVWLPVTRWWCQRCGSEVSSQTVSCMCEETPK